MNGKNILIIDDDENDRLLLNSELTMKGYNVTALSSGHNALSTLKNDTFDAVTLNLFMPEMDGTETLQAIKWKFPEMPVIAMSGLSKDYLPMMVHLGAYSVAEKSQCFKNVVEKLDQCLSANRLKKEALNVG